jgi:hypothetical protein
VVRVGRSHDFGDVAIVLSEADRTPRIPAQTANWCPVGAQEAVSDAEFTSKPGI